MCSVISAKGQVTIPMSIRSLLNWQTDDALDFVLHEENRVELVVKKTPVTSLKSLIDKPKRALSLAEMEAAIGAGGRA